MEPRGIDVTKVNWGPYDTGFNDWMVNGIGELLAATIHAASGRAPDRHCRQATG